MDQQAPSLGFFLGLYCVISIVAGVGLFMFALIGLKNLSGAPDGLGLIVVLFFITAFLNFFLVYRLTAVKSPMTIYMVRAFEASKVVLTLFAVFSSEPETALYLLVSLIALLYFFKSKRVKALYFVKQTGAVEL
ncbi:hypothetical protein OURE66S_03162 [Oligella ureolytica]|nr:hypothetical protein [Alcaligenaceae bacterium]